jgi:multiple sugar transport system permease protein
MYMNAEITILLYVGLIIVLLMIIRLLGRKFLKPVKYRKLKESVSAYLYLLPSFVVLGLFVFWPIIYSFYLSFFKWDFQNQDNPIFIGFENYIKLFKLDKPISISFNSAFFNTLLLVMSFIFFMHLIFDYKKIEKRYQKTL